MGVNSCTLLPTRPGALDDPLIQSPLGMMGGADLHGAMAMPDSLPLMANGASPTVRRAGLVKPLARNHPKTQTPLHDWV